MNRTQKSIRNLSFGLLARFVTTLLSFVTRTAMVKLLGIEAVSINSLFNEVIAALSLAELGIGSAIVFNLYKPLAENDREKVSQLMNFFKRAYRIIAIVTLGVGVFICPWIQIFINDISYDISYLRIVYILFVIQCSSSYLFAYKTALLEADQKTYISSQISVVLRIIGTIFLLIILFVTKKYIIYLCANICLTVGINAFLSHKVDNLYPWISKTATLPVEEKKNVFSNVKNIFVKQLAGKIVNSTDNILISSLVSTILVGYYSNYAVVISVFKQLSDQINSSITASMGNLFVSDTKDKSILLLNRLTYIFSIFAIVSAVGIYSCIQPFVSLWIGANFLLEESLVLMLAILLFFYIAYKPLSTAMHLSGYFKIGRNISFTSALANLIVSVILGLRVGILGIFAGTLVTYIIEIISKIYFLFKLYFESDCRKYVALWLKMLCIFALLLLVCEVVSNTIKFSNLCIQFGCMGLFAVLSCGFLIHIFTKNSDEYEYAVTLIRKTIIRK